MIAVFLAPQNENNFSENALILFDWTFIWHLVQSEFKNLSLLNISYSIFIYSNFSRDEMTINNIRTPAQNTIQDGHTLSTIQ